MVASTCIQELSKHRLDSRRSWHLLVPPWLLAPSWMPTSLGQPWEQSEGVLRRQVGCASEPLEMREHGHRVSFVASMAYCARCACFA